MLAYLKMTGLTLSETLDLVLVALGPMWHWGPHDSKGHRP